MPRPLSASISTAINQAQTAASVPKHRLMEIRRALDAAGAPRKAAALSAIIARLERWQNTP